MPPNYCSLILTNEELKFLGFDVDDSVKNTMYDAASKLFVIDCEMVKTTLGQEVVALCLVDQDRNVIMNEMMKPVGEVIDYVTHITGFTEETFRDITTSIHDVIAKLKTYVSVRDILAGHDIFSDITPFSAKNGTVPVKKKISLIHGIIALYSFEF
jgi:RNA exonuclease 1